MKDRADWERELLPDQMGQARGGRDRGRGNPLWGLHPAKSLSIGAKCITQTSSDALLLGANKVDVGAGQKDRLVQDVRLRNLHHHGKFALEDKACCAFT